MDDIDRKILRTLQDHPEMPLADLAPLVGLSQTPCWRRLKKLESQGTIRGRAVLLDPAMLGLTVNVFAYIKLKSHDEATLEALESAVEKHSEIIECFSMSGDSDYLLRVIVASVEAYERFLKRELLHLPGVGSINSSFALKRVKETTVLPI
ncbi:MAG: Lrp/AsnC family transcriptional regulator [Novosphingobium sp.]|nr:Lrp/AsnC family transcriptional regulator [Novosphingobium sp.]